MKTTQLAARDQQANNRILAAAETLAKRFDIDSNIMDDLRVQRGAVALRALHQRESVATLLEIVVELMPPKRPAKKAATKKGT